MISERIRRLTEKQTHRFWLMYESGLKIETNSINNISIKITKIPPNHIPWYGFNSIFFLFISYLWCDLVFLILSSTIIIYIFKLNCMFIKLVTLAMAFLYEINDNLADGVRTVDKIEKNMACDKD